MRRFQVYLPMTASCGAFVICVGLGLIAGGFSANLIYPGLAVGFGTGFIAMILTAIVSARKGRARPNLAQQITPSICAIFEVMVLMALAPYLPRDTRTLFVVVLGVVGVHFLPMMVSYGSLVGGLGLACALAAGVAWATPGEPLSLILLVDGGLKLAFGLAMLRGLAVPRPSAALS
jgi:hypothetical protein